MPKFNGRCQGYGDYHTLYLLLLKDVPSSLIEPAIHLVKKVAIKESQNKWKIIVLINAIKERYMGIWLTRLSRNFLRK